MLGPPGGGAGTPRARMAAHSERVRSSLPAQRSILLGLLQTPTTASPGDRFVVWLVGAFVLLLTRRKFEMAVGCEEPA